MGVECWELYRCTRGLARKSGKFDSVKRRVDFDQEIKRRPAIGWCWVTPRRTSKTLKVELEKQTACVETNETKMMERADQEAHQQNLWGHILRSTAAPVAVTALAIEAATAEAWVTISTSPPAILSAVTVVTAIDDGDGDWIVASKPKRGDGLDVFVADLGNACSYVNAVRKNQKRKTERRKDLAHYNGVASYEFPENNDDGQRMEKNVVEH